METSPGPFGAGAVSRASWRRRSPGREPRCGWDPTQAAEPGAQSPHRTGVLWGTAPGPQPVPVEGGTFSVLRKTWPAEAPSRLFSSIT